MGACSSKLAEQNPEKPIAATQNKSNTQPLCFSDLPNYLVHHITDYIADEKASTGDIKTIACLAGTHKHFHGLFRKSANAERDQRVALLLQHVIRGEPKEVDEILKRNPSLLLYKAEVTDYSGRKIRGTAYQIALGAEDPELIKIIKNYLTTLAGEKEVLAQFNAQFPVGWKEREKKQWAPIVEQLEKLDKTIQEAKANDIISDDHCKLTVRKDSSVESELTKLRCLLDATTAHPIETGRHFNPDFLRELFERNAYYYCEYDYKHNLQRSLFWQRVVGYIQRFLPTNDAQAFCNGLSKTQEQLKTEEPINRSLKLEYYDSVSNRSLNCLFYPLDDSLLGFDRGVSGGVMLCSGLDIGTILEGYANQKRAILEQLHHSEYSTINPALDLNFVKLSSPTLF